ncbi:MAG: IS5/IS1182 family transposase, partial [Candidatus Hydrogenedentota bacterium]
TEAKEKYKERSGEIEPIFGILKTRGHLRQFYLRSKEKVEIEIKLASIAFNIGKLGALLASN